MGFLRENMLCRTLFWYLYTHTCRNNGEKFKLLVSVVSTVTSELVQFGTDLKCACDEVINAGPHAISTLITCLAPWAGKMNRISRCDWLPERERWSHLGRSGYALRSASTQIMLWCFIPYDKSFIDQACSVKMAGYWPRSFFACLWKNLANIQPILTSRLVNNPYITVKCSRSTTPATNKIHGYRLQ